MKRCRICGVLKLPSEYYKKCDTVDGLQSDCRTCRSEINKQYKKDKKRGNARDIYKNWGGSYRVVYDPWDSFTAGSSFRRREISEMLASRYLAIGTRFRRGIDEWEVSSKNTLLEVTA